MKGHTHGGIYTRKDVHGEDIHTEGDADEETYTRRDIQIEKHTHRVDIYIVQTV